MPTWASQHSCLQKASECKFLRSDLRCEHGDRDAVHHPGSTGPSSDWPPAFGRVRSTTTYHLVSCQPRGSRPNTSWRRGLSQKLRLSYLFSPGHHLSAGITTLSHTWKQRLREAKGLSIHRPCLTACPRVCSKPLPTPCSAHGAFSGPQPPLGHFPVMLPKGPAARVHECNPSPHPAAVLPLRTLGSPHSGATQPSSIPALPPRPQQRMGGAGLGAHRYVDISMGGTAALNRVQG